MAPLFGFKYTPVAYGYEITEAGLFQWFNLKIPEEKNGRPVVAIGERAFAGISDVFKVTIPKSVHTIGKNAFWGCSSIRDIIIEGSASIGDRTFYNCKNLRSVMLSNVTSIGKEAFKGCKKLRSITLPNSLTELDSRAFLDCPDIEYINIPTAMTEIKQTSFFCFKNVRRFHIHKGIRSIEWGAFSACASVEEFTVDEENPFYTAIDGNLYTKDGKILIAYASGKKDTHFDVPTHVETIWGAAFQCSNYLKTVDILDGVKSIGFNAFAFCPALESVSIPDTVETVDMHLCWQSNKNVIIRTPFSTTPDGWNESWHYVDFNTAAKLERVRRKKQILD